MIEALERYRPAILQGLAEIDTSAAGIPGSPSVWGDDLRRRLMEFTSRGKLIRGTLVALASDMLGRAPDAAVRRTGAALELVQSFLLVHDDIMDEDTLRRGAPAVFEQYRVLATQREYARPDRFGESMGICLGDVAVLLAIDAMTTPGPDAETALRLVRLVAREIAGVGVAQMADVANGHAVVPATEEEITSVYRLKTGRYTFSLPLMLGATLAGAEEAVVDGLSRWGEIEGIIFQIRDDELGVMGATDSIGKPAGSDIIANKQTLHRLELFRRADDRWADVLASFGVPGIGDRALERVREALVQTGTIAALAERVESLRHEASIILRDTPVSTHARDFLVRLDEYNATRER